ncbi:MAG TPA: choice-of-anchor A family protein [Chloroflexia bacterium]|nr:choice-of-anchor A family protein [Chloroflexia bacterium]
MNTKLPGSTANSRPFNAPTPPRSRRGGRTKWLAGLLALWLVMAAFSPVMVTQAATSTAILGWGYNTYGATNVPAGLNDAIAISAGSYHSLALRSNGTVVLMGTGPLGLTPVPAGLNNVVAISAGNLHDLALKNDGTVVVWGSNAFGQLNIPAGLSNVTAISAGSLHSLALKSDGTVVAWGDNSQGQLNIPAGLNNVTAISTKFNHNLALKSDGTVVAWGASDNGQTNVPAGLSNVVAISAGIQHSLALKSDGTVVAWGDNSIGQLNIPAGLHNVIAIAAGGYHSLALKSDGTIVGWGSGGLGQLNIPAGLHNVIAITAGWGFSLVLTQLQQSQTITFPQPAGKTFGDAPFALNATASSGLPVSYSSNSPAVCSVSGNTVTLLGPGICSITASQAGNAGYLPATPVTRTFNVAPSQVLPNPLPTTFNVLSLGGLKMTSTEVQGQIGAGGNSAFNGTNLGTANTNADAVLVQGSVAFNNWGNQVNGNVVYSGAASSTFATFVRGGFVRKASALPVAALAAYARQVSDAWQALPVNGTTDVKPWGQIILTGTSVTRNVFTVSGAALSATNSLVINAPTSSEVIVNVTGDGSRMQYMGVQLNGVNPAKLVYNIRSTTTFTVNGVGLQGLVWAARADVTFSNAQLKGTLVGKSVTDTSGRFESLPYQGTLPALS